jgi:hypothetical protein
MVGKYVSLGQHRTSDVLISTQSSSRCHQDTAIHIPSLISNGQEFMARVMFWRQFGYNLSRDEGGAIRS